MLHNREQHHRGRAMLKLISSDQDFKTQAECCALKALMCFKTSSQKSEYAVHKHMLMALSLLCVLLASKQT